MVRRRGKRNSTWRHKAKGPGEAYVQSARDDLELLFADSLTVCACVCIIIIMIMTL